VSNLRQISGNEVAERLDN